MITQSCFVKWMLQNRVKSWISLAGWRLPFVWFLLETPPPWYAAIYSCILYLMCNLLEFVVLYSEFTTSLFVWRWLHRGFYLEHCSCLSTFPGRINKLHRQKSCHRYPHNIKKPALTGKLTTPNGVDFSRVAQNLEILEKLSSPGGPTFIFGYMERKKIFKIFFSIFATRPGPANIYPMHYSEKKKLRQKWVPGVLKYSSWGQNTCVRRSSSFVNF